MGIETALVAASVGVGLASGVAGYSEQQKAKKQAEAATAQQNAAYKKQYQASVEASDASKRGAQAREAQMILDSRRQKRQLIRDAQVARSQAIARASNAGAGVGPLGVDASVLAGQNQITSQQGYGTQVIGQNLDIGKQLFQSEYDILAANKKAAAAGTQANYAGVQLQNAQAQSNYGSSLIGLGQSFISNASTFGSVGASSVGYARSLFTA